MPRRQSALSTAVRPAPVDRHVAKDAAPRNVSVVTKLRVGLAVGYKDTPELLKLSQMHLLSIIGTILDYF